MSSAGEGTPLLPGAVRGRVEGRSSTHDVMVLGRPAERRTVGIIFMGMFLFYVYLLYLLPSRASVVALHTSSSPSTQPSAEPSEMPSVAPSMVAVVRPSTASDDVYQPSFRPNGGNSTTQHPSLPQAYPTVEPSIGPSNEVVVPTDMTCQNKETFQESAARLVYPSLQGLSLAVRGTVELLKNALGTYSFAYFPLLGGIGLEYTMWTVTDMDMVEAPHWPVADVYNTTDPIEVLIYYTNKLYTAIGDLEDSKTGTDLVKIACMQALVNNLTFSWNQTISTDIIPGLSWSEYLQYPGPNGRVWADGTKVTWAISSAYAHKSSALYLGESDRIIDDQLWGDSYPRQGSSVMDAIRQLIHRQVDESIHRYKMLVDLDPTGKGNWATSEILTSTDGILIYHRVRKVLRMIGVTIDAFPEVISAFYNKIPERVIKFANLHYNAGLKVREMSYGDVFCYKAVGDKAYSFSTPKYKCTGPVTSIGTMIFANVSAFDADFFQIDRGALDTLRILLMIKAFRLGEQKVLPNTTACPGLHSSFIQVNRNSSIDPFVPMDSWVQPALLDDGYSIVGTVCEFDDYFGDIHDLFVKIQQHAPIVNDNFENYAVSVSKGLQQFLNVVQLPHALKFNLLNGLCRERKGRE